MIGSAFPLCVRYLPCGPPVDVNIVFRADASLQIGSGHVMRCLALAGALRDRGATVRFACRDFSGHLAGLIQEQGFDCFLFDRPDESYRRQEDDPAHAEWLGVSWRRDAEETVRALGGEQPDWLIVDHYAIDYRWHREVRSCASSIMVIDDLADRRYDCDILLDQTHGRHDEEYRELVPASASLLLGAEYALLRPEFARQRRAALEARRRRAGIRRILVAMGGVDSVNATSAVLRGLAGVEWSEKPQVDVVLGGSAPHLEEVKALADECGLPVRVLSNVRNMSELMMEADLAVGAGGSTSWERCCLGLPSLLVETAENQREVVAGLDRAGAAIALSLENLQEGVAAACRGLQGDPARLAGLAARAAGVTDGLGAPLCAIRLTPSLAKDGAAVTLRRIEEKDADLIYEWQSDPETRRHSHDSAVPEYSSHLQWLTKKLADPGCYFYMIESNGAPAGVVRLDYQADADGEPAGYLLSIYTAPGYYRRGVGGVALNYINGLFSECVLYADILPENVASQRLFTSAGFNQTGESGRYVRPNAG